MIMSVVGTSPQVPLEKFFRMGVVLPLQSQLNEKVHQVGVRMDVPKDYQDGRTLGPWGAPPPPPDTQIR